MRAVANYFFSIVNLISRQTPKFPPKCSEMCNHSFPPLYPHLVWTNISSTPERLRFFARNFTDARGRERNSYRQDTRVASRFTIFRASGRADGKAHATLITRTKVERKKKKRQLFQNGKARLLSGRPVDARSACVARWLAAGRPKLRRERILGARYRGFGSSKHLDAEHQSRARASLRAGTSRLTERGEREAKTAK